MGLSLRLLAAGMVVLGGPVWAADTDWVDAVDLASSTERSSHATEIRNGRLVSERATFGRLHEPIAGVELAPGGVVQLTLRTAAPRPTSLAVRLATRPAHHGRAQELSVEVDGQRLCAMADVDPGAGATRTLFLDLPPTGPRTTIRLKASYRGAVPPIVSMLRTYALPHDPGGERPTDPYRMAIALVSNQQGGYAIDRAELMRLTSRVPSSPYLQAQGAVLYRFAAVDLAEQTRTMRELADTAVSARRPLRICFQIHRGGITPGMPDGAGGSFVDLPYQQITWDAADGIDEPGLQALMGDRYDRRYGLSMPNVHGSTPWLTMNHPRLNQFLRIRLRQALSAWLGARDRLTRWGLAGLLPGQLSTGDETTYWAKGVDDSSFTAMNGGRPRAALLADFNPYVLVDAMSDGIHLDPQNGLDRNERWWLHQNLSRRQQSIVDWMLEALPSDPIRAGSDGIRLADDLIRRNIYTEPFGLPLFPLRGVHELRPGIELGYVQDGRSGAQYSSGAAILTWLLKQRERGRTALPRLPCNGTSIVDIRTALQAAYAHGARFAVLYDSDTQTEMADALEGLAEALRKPIEWPVPAFAEHRSGEPPIWRAEYEAAPDAFAINEIRVALAPPSGPDTPLRLTIRTVDERPERRFELVGSASGLDAEVSTLTVSLPAMFRQRPGARYALTLEALDGDGRALPPSSIRPLGARLFSDLRRERWRGLAVGDRQDALDLIASLDRGGSTSAVAASSDWLARAKQEVRRGRPGSAYACAVKAEQYALPCTFLVSPPGATLAPMPLEVRCPDDPVRVTVLSIDDGAATLSAIGSVKQTIRVSFRGQGMTVTVAPGTPVELMLQSRGAPRAATEARARSAEP